MALAHPVWTFAPQWENGITERLEWLTDMLASIAGTEQRRCMRMAPRRFFEATFLLTGRERQSQDIYTFMAGGIDLYIPLWPEVVHLVAPLPAGSISIPVDPVDREFRNGDYVLLRQSAFDYEVVQVQDTSMGSLQLIANTTNTWGVGTAVYPLRLARFDEQPQYTKHTDTFWELAVKFRLIETADFPATPTLDSYQGFPVFNARPDESDDLTHGYQRKMSTLDNQVGIPKFLDMGGLGFTTQQYRWALAGRAAYAEFRRTLYMLRGRWKSFWLPTFMQDMTISQDIASGDNFIRIKEMGYTEFGGAVKGRKNIRIELTDGTHLYKEIVSSAPIGVGEERLALTDTFAANIPMSSIRSISYMALSRLDADAVEIQHETDGDGLTLCNVSTASAPNLREATEWNVPPILAYTGTPLGCLPPCDPVSQSAWTSNSIAQNGWMLNPDTHEIWVPPSSGILSSSGVLVGTRISSVTLDDLGEVYVPHTIFGSDFRSMIYPGFTYIPGIGPNGRMYLAGWDSEFNHRQFAMFDAATGEFLVGRDVTFEMPSSWLIEFHYMAKTNTLYAITYNFADTVIYIVDKDSLMPTYLTTLSNRLYKQGSPTLGPDGNLYFVLTDGTPSGSPSYKKSIYRFDGTAISLVYVNGIDVLSFISDPDSGTLWLGEDSSITGSALREMNLSGSLTGRSLAYIPSSSFIGYDARNHVMWRLAIVSSPLGAMYQYQMVDKTTGAINKVMDYYTSPILGNGATNSMVPSSGTPNALYLITIQYVFTPVFAIVGRAVKALVCNARNP